jgi:hypothetical protein
MTKLPTKKSKAVGWFASAITKGGLSKAKKLGFLPESMEVVFPSDEVVPYLADGFQVMFLSFLLHGLSLHAQNFSVGSFLFMVCSCISSRPILSSTFCVLSCYVRRSSDLIRTRGCGNGYSISVATPQRRKSMMFVELSLMCMQMRSISNSPLRILFNIGVPNGSMSRTRNPLKDKNKELKKLKTWDQLPSEAELAETEPLITRIVKQKTAFNMEMNGVQLIAYILRIRIQPVKARISQLWNYAGPKDQSRTSEEEALEEIIQKQVRALTKLTKKNLVPPCPTAPYSTSKSLPKA